MPNTVSGIPYPLSTDPPNGAAQMQAIAAAVEGIFAGGGSVAYGYNSAASYTSTSGLTTAVTCNVTIPTYWVGWRMFGIGHWATAITTNNFFQIAVNGTIVPNSLAYTNAAGVVIGSATGSATGAIAVALQVNGVDGGPSPFSSLQIMALAIRNA